MEKLNCVIERVTYHNEENGFSVVKASAQGHHDTITAVGTMPDVKVGAVFDLYGEWKFHSKFGKQFSFQRCEESLPATVNGIKKYLGSGLIRGIGPAYAERIVKQFGEKTLTILDKEPERLSEVPGIGTKRLEQIKKSWNEQREIRNIMLFLQSHDVSTSIATKIYKQYGNQSIQMVTENPYRLADEIWGIGFKTADTVAKKLGFGHERFERLKSGLIYTLKNFSDEGHCFAYKDDLISAGKELLEVEEEQLTQTLEHMIEDKNVILDDAIYLPLYYYSEVGVANHIKRLMSGPKIKYIKNAPNDFKYDEIQLEAIQAALTNKVFILTGGPGTGKTTCVNGIIRAYNNAGAKILLAAPTGRAAKRMSEVTGKSAKTIHRLLEMRPPEGFQRNEKNPLEGDVLIVDECSMIDVVLMNSLLKAVPDKMNVILVGDVDQLPSVGAGKVLSDIIASRTVPVIKLEKIFRQAQASRIITNAHLINKGSMPFLTDHDSDFLFFPEDKGKTSAENSDLATEKVIELCTKILPAKGINPDDIQVITPMRRGSVGATNLNQKLQSALNSETLKLSRGGIDYKLTDRVMQIRNNYEKGVFNGDIGFITEVHPTEDELLVTFDDRSVPYDITELDELVLAYATTIHKSQGSEFPYIVMPIVMSHFIMLQRNLLYTGVTRAKQGLFMVGENKAIYIAVKNDKIAERNTKLAERLK